MTVNGSAQPHEASTEAKELWRHSDPHSTQIYDFMHSLNQKYQLSLQNYNDLWQWSISKPSEFWEEIWHYTNVKAHKPYERVSSSTLSALIGHSSIFEGLYSYQGTEILISARSCLLRNYSFPDLTSLREAN
jgi:acetoacetyl-CoA synthetase